MLFANTNKKVKEQTILDFELTDETEQTDTDEKQEANDTVEKYGSPELPKTPQSRIHCLSIIGQIEGHMLLPPQNKTTKYEHLIPQLIAIEQSNDIDGFLIVMNTVGGDVEAGLALAEMVASMEKPSVSLVLGGGHSIGVPLAVSADYSFIAETATMTIHPIRMSGMIISVPQTYEYFNKMQERVVTYIVNHSNIKKKRLNELMTNTGDMMNDIGTVLLGKEAVDCGIIDEIGGLSSALKKLNELIEVKKK